MAARLTTYLVVAIVGATLIAGLIVGAQRNDGDGPIDIIVHNAAVYTADASGTMAEALAVRGNQVLRVGSNREIMRLQRPQTIVIDARGGAVLPGFNDSGRGLVNAGLALDAIDLAGAADLADVRARIAAWAVANPDRPWVAGHGWDPSLVPSDTTPRRWLDTVVADRPAAMVSADNAAVWVNTQALQSVAPRSGQGSRTRAKGPGATDGVLTGPDLTRLLAALPRPTRAAKSAALRAAVAEAHRVGITSVQHIGATAEDFDLYAEAQRGGELDIRVYGAVDVSGAASDAEIGKFEGIANRYPDDPLLKAGAVTLAVDGSAAAMTAAMLQPPINGTNAAEPLLSADELNRVVRLLDARGWQVILHASGDRAVSMALAALEHAARSNPAPARGRRHRIDGIEAIDPADVPRLKSLGLILSTDVIALMSATSSTARLVIGSGWPSGPVTPLFTLQAAITGAHETGRLDAAAGAGPHLTVKRALNAMTSSAAYASFDEHRKGTLGAGMLADVVILSADIFTVEPSRIAAVDVAATIFDGRVVYRRDGKSFP